MQDKYAEQLVRMEGLTTSFVRPTNRSRAKHVGRLQLGLHSDDHVYICPQTLMKFHPSFDVVLVGVLLADPR
jgi:predicted O-linked N-acetylglucosamine transferase (SPINDLY family)